MDLLRSTKFSEGTDNTRRRGLGEKVWDCRQYWTPHMRLLTWSCDTSDGLSFSILVVETSEIPNDPVINPVHMRNSILSMFGSHLCICTPVTIIWRTDQPNLNRQPQSISSLLRINIHNSPLHPASQTRRTIEKTLSISHFLIVHNPHSTILVLLISITKLSTLPLRLHLLPR